MSSASPAIRLQARLPSLDGWRLWLYRLLWFATFAAAGLAHVVLLVSPTMAPAILGLRLLKAVVIFAVATILFRRRQRDPVAALLSFALLLWTITSSVDFAAADGLLPQLLDRTRFLLFALALLLFPDGEWRSRAGRAVAAASAAVFLVGVVEALQLTSTRAFLPLAIACVLAAAASLIARFRTASSEALRQQLKWVALGLASGLALILGARAGAWLSLASPTLGALPVLWEAMFQLGIIAIALGFLVSLLRYRLYDAEAAISRSASYAAVTVTLVAVFAGTEATIENLGQAYLGMGIGNISAAMAAAVAAVLLNPIHSRITAWAEGRFQRDLVLLKQELPELLEDLAASASPAQLGLAILPRINAAVHATRSALITAEGVVVAVAGDVRPKEAERWSARWNRHAARPARCAPEDRRFPVRFELACPISGRTGWLVLGPRPDGSLFAREDLEALDFVRPAIRRAWLWATAHERLRTAQQRGHPTRAKSLMENGGRGKD